MSVALLQALFVWTALFAFGPWTAAAVVPLTLLALGVGVEWARWADEAETHL